MSCCETGCSLPRFRPGSLESVASQEMQQRAPAQALQRRAPRNALELRLLLHVCRHSMLAGNEQVACLPRWKLDSTACRTACAWALCCTLPPSPMGGIIVASPCGARQATLQGVCALLYVHHFEGTFAAFPYYQLCLQVVSQMAAEAFPKGTVEALNPADHSLDMSVEVTVGVTPADEDRAPRAATFAHTALPDGSQELTAEVDVELSPDAIGEQGDLAACEGVAEPASLWDCHPWDGCCCVDRQRGQVEQRAGAAAAPACAILLFTSRCDSVVQPALGFVKPQVLPLSERVLGRQLSSWTQHLPMIWVAAMVCRDFVILTAP